MRLFCSFFFRCDSFSFSFCSYSLVYTFQVGSGGNAGNQSCVAIIQGIAYGTLNSQTRSKFVVREGLLSICLAFTLAIVGMMRCWLQGLEGMELLSVGCSLSLTVMSAIILGAALPLFLQRLGANPAHASTALAVVMDILGVSITCLFTRWLMD